MPTLEVATAFSAWYSIAPVSTGNGNYTFTANLPQRDDWMLRVSKPGEKSVLVAVDPANPSVNLQLEEGVLPTLGFDVHKAIDTPTGFWRGAVSETEKSVVLFPGQENWAAQDTVTQIALKQSSMLYKYTFSGELLWSHATGWETWGGAMTPDGSRIAYLTNPDISQTDKLKTLVLLDGSDGQVLWKIDDPMLRSLEGLEVALSDDGRWMVSGTSQGVVGLFDTQSKTLVAEWDAARGQIRKLVFDPSGKFLYVGSGDNYLYKIEVATRTEVWKAEVGGWPFINGLDFSSDGGLVAVGTKSKEMTLVDTTTGEVLWRKEGYMDVNIAPDNSIAVNFAGDIYSLGSGERVGDTGSAAVVSYLQSAGQLYIVQADRKTVKLFDSTGASIATFNDTSDTQAGSGEQSQWSYLTEDQQYLIVASRDMSTPGERGLTIWNSRAFQASDIAASGGPPNQLPPLNNQGAGGDQGANILPGTALNDQINGLGGDDTFFAGTGSDVFNGGDGIDRVEWARSAADFELRFSQGQITVVEKNEPGNVLRIENVEFLNFNDREVSVATKGHGPFNQVPDELWHFFIVAFGGAPGVTYMEQLTSAFDAGLPLQEIVDIFTSKSQFTDLYPISMSSMHFATLLTDNVVKQSASDAARDKAVNDIVSALDSGLTRGEVIYNIFGNLAKVPSDNATWGNTSSQFQKQISVAQFYTDTLSQSTTDIATLRSVLDRVDASSIVDSEEALIQIVGNALLGVESV